MPSLTCTYPASASRPVRFLDVLHTDSGGTPTTATKAHDLGSERTSGGTATISLTAAQAPAGRRFAVKARNDAGTSGLSPVASVPGGSTGTPQQPTNLRFETPPAGGTKPFTPFRLRYA